MSRRRPPSGSDGSRRRKKRLRAWLEASNVNTSVREREKRQPGLSLFSSTPASPSPSPDQALRSRQSGAWQVEIRQVQLPPPPMEERAPAMLRKECNSYVKKGNTRLVQRESQCGFTGGSERGWFASLLVYVISCLLQVRDADKQVRQRSKSSEKQKFHSPYNWSNCIWKGGNGQSFAKFLFFIAVPLYRATIQEIRSFPYLLAFNNNEKPCHDTRTQTIMSFYSGPQ